MALELTPLEYNTFFILTIIVMAIKFFLMLFLGKKMYDRKKEKGEFSFGFIFGVFILFACLLISRIFYFQFDFILTGFDLEKYYTMPNILVWKIASFIASLGFATFIFIVDKRILNFKLKGLISYLIMIFATIQLLYPVNSVEDFQLVSMLVLFTNVIAIIIPALFFYMGWKAADYRKPCFTIAIGAIFYAIGENINIEAFMSYMVSIFGFEIRIVIFFLALLFKAMGLILFSYGVTKFVIVFS